MSGEEDFKFWNNKYGYSKIFYLICNYDKNNETKFKNELNSLNFFDTDPEFKSTLFHVACELQNFELCDYLIKFMKKRGISMDYLNQPDCFKDTPLHTAAYLQNDDIIKLFQENGANEEIKNIDNETVKENLQKSHFNFLMNKLN